MRIVSLEKIVSSDVEGIPRPLYRALNARKIYAESESVFLSKR